MSQTNSRLQSGGLILPQGSSPGNVNVGELALIIDTDGTLKTQNAAGAKAAIGGGFGADTTISLPDSGATPVTALELINTLTVNTPGATVSRWVVKLLSAGAQVTALQIDPLATSFPSGTAALPGITFVADALAGIHYSAAGGGTIGIDVQGVQQVGVLANLFILWSGVSVLAWGSGQTETISKSGTSLTFKANSATRMIMDATGIGFQGTAGIAKPTVSGSKGANAALASLMTALANYGLVTDSTT